MPAGTNPALGAHAAALERHGVADHTKRVMSSRSIGGETDIDGLAPIVRTQHALDVHMRGAAVVRPPSCAALPPLRTHGGRGAPAVKGYRICIRGQVVPLLGGICDGMAIGAEAAGTVVVGSFPTQAALYRFLVRLRDLGLQVVSTEELGVARVPSAGR